MTVKSKALEVNLASYHVDVDIEERYLVLREVMSKYYGLQERVETFLKELSHPYKNWQFIVQEARTFSLDYFHQLQNHEKGARAAELYVNIFAGAVKSAKLPEIKNNAADNLLLFLSRLSRAEAASFLPVVLQAFAAVHRLEGDNFFAFVKSYYQVHTVARNLLGSAVLERDGFGPVNALLIKYYQHVYRYWRHEKDCLSWFHKEIEGINDLEPDILERIQAIVKDISHKQINLFAGQLTRIANREDPDQADTCRMLLDLPGYDFFVSAYRRLPGELLRAGGTEYKGNRWKLLALFLILNTPGLSVLHEESLRDINSTLSSLISGEEPARSRELIKRTFQILKEKTNRFPHTALNCVLNIGKNVYSTDNTDLINYFIDAVIFLGFHPPQVEGVDNDWKIKANQAHLQNIRTWLELIELNPQKSTRLLSALIIHLSVSGVLIRDTDLFPRDITTLLNSQISPVYNLVKQLTRLMPVFFNDIGAEGVLRDISTEIDELSHRKDALVHFLRKQGHVEGSNRLIAFMEAAINFWLTREKPVIKPYLPPEMYDQIDENGPYVTGLHTVFQYFAAHGINLPRGLLAADSDRIDELCRQVPDVDDRDRRRAALAVAYYKLLDQKYNIGFTEIDHYIAQLDTSWFPDITILKQALAEEEPRKQAARLLDYLKSLKKLILSDKEFEVQQNIYEKRHITVDIPSMYGSYRETKFDALGLSFRLEALVNVLFEEIIDNIDLSLITKTTFFEIYGRLKLLVRALALDGFSTKEIALQLDLLSHALKTHSFSFTQFIDIFKKIATAVKNIINDHFHNPHGKNIARIIPSLPTESFLDKYLPETGPDGRAVPLDREKMVHRVSEIFFREKIALSLGLAQLDLFLSRILNVLFHQLSRLPKERLERLLNYDPARIIARIDEKESRKYGIIYLGNKGFNLISLKGCGCPIPPGFINTTEVFKCREIIDNYQPADDIFRQSLREHLCRLEEESGKLFGKPENPLLLSVRSGASISQPGMMDTALNVGMNEEITRGLAEISQNPWFAWDNYRRFLQCYGMAFGLNRDDFDAIMSAHKARWNVPLKKEFSGQQMEQLALAYKQKIEDAGVRVVDDPFEQLYVTIKNVFDSWHSQKAQTYRKIVGISDDWGTAVTVQAMVYGNITSSRSGSGVFFTHSPRLSGEAVQLWGDFTIGNQGEDVVAGLVTTLPISLAQKNA
ncbi:MAG: PEP/pyruvate-binding domain-containing protein, partial [Desulfosudaceae bacterium]